MMNTTSKFVLLCCFVASWSGLLSGQEVIVTYNLHNDSITWSQDGKPLKKNRLRKGQDVVFRLTEFNPFLYDLDVKMEESADAGVAPISGGAVGLGAFTGLLPGFSAMPSFGGLMPSNLEAPAQESPRTSLFDIPLLTLNDNPITLKSLFAGSRGGEQAMDLANQTMREISTLVEEIQAIQLELETANKAMTVTRLAIEQTEKIIHHPNIKPSLIKQMCGEYYAAVFQKPMDAQVSLDDLLGWIRLPNERALLHQRLANKQTELSQKISFLQTQSDQITGLDSDDATYRKFTRDLLDFLGKTKKLDSQMKTSLSIPQVSEPLPTNQQMAALQLRLAEIMSSEFTHREHFKPTADKLAITVRLLEKKDSSKPEPAVVKQRKIPLEIRGGLRVNASVGVNFAQFFSPAQTYSVSNGVIIGEDQGDFTPSVASFLHFHGYRGQRATLGGSFGIGFPVLADGDNQSLQFFLGPSVVLGSGQKLVLTAGFTGGRVQRLAKGFQIGDPFDANLGDIPLQGKYGLGAFFGVSFNLGN